MLFVGQSPKFQTGIASEFFSKKFRCIFVITKFRSGRKRSSLLPTVKRSTYEQATKSRFALIENFCFVNIVRRCPPFFFAISNLNPEHFFSLNTSFFFLIPPTASRSRRPPRKPPPSHPNKPTPVASECCVDPTKDLALAILTPSNANHLFRRE